MTHAVEEQHINLSFYKGMLLKGRPAKGNSPRGPNEFSMKRLFLTLVFTLVAEERSAAAALSRQWRDRTGGIGPRWQWRFYSVLLCPSPKREYWGGILPGDERSGIDAVAERVDYRF